LSKVRIIYQNLILKISPVVNLKCKYKKTLTSSLQEIMQIIAE